MINRIIEFSMKNRWLVLAVYAALAVWGYWALLHTPIDAIPDLSENQVIVFTDWAGRSPQEVEDQITYPLTVNLQGLPHVRTVRSASAFGFSMVNVIFEDSVDIYFARTRVLERLSLAGSFLPAGVTPMMGPDATGVGQVFWYTVEGPYDSGTLHSIQDWFIKYQLNSVPGVAEVASVGGFVKQYQIDLDPIKLRAYNIPLKDVVAAVERSNNNVGAKVMEVGDTEDMVRGIGLIRGLKDIEDISLGAYNGTPVTVGNVASVQLGPEFRRGVLDKDGKEAVGGVVVIRYGANAREVIAAVKQKIDEIQPGLPAGVHIVPFYDRSILIDHAVDTLRHALIEEIILVTLAHVLFLWHFRSILVVTIPLPLAVLGAFLFMKGAGISSNIMSLGGIAIAIGVLVDAGIVMTENVIRQAEQYEARARQLSRAHLGDHAERRAAGGPSHLLCHGHHHSGLRSRLRTHRHGRQDVSSAGLHQDLRHGLLHHSRHHAGSGALHVSHSRQAAPRGREPDHARPARHLPARAELGASSPHHHARRRAGAVLRAPSTPQPPSAPSSCRRSMKRRRSSCPSPIRASRSPKRPKSFASRTASSPPTRSRHGGRQSRPRRNLHRSRARQHVRNHHHLQAKGPVAQGAHQGRDPGAARRQAADSRRHQHLDAAHPQPHRHALDRHPHPDRHQGLRPRPARDRSRSRRRSRRS